MKRLSLLFICSLCLALCHATTRSTTHATLFGFGHVSQLDTYLSPLNYSGPQFHLMQESLRMTHLADSAISFQTIWQGNLSYTKNAPGKARYIGGNCRFDATWHYHLQAGPVRLLLGPQIGSDIGFLYNTRNGNNPAQAQLSAHLGASAAAIYPFRLWRQPLTVRYQLDLPLLGLMFSPNYGQSYYEIFSLGNTDHNVCLTHPFNAFSSRHLLTVDIPLRGVTLRTGYLCDIRQSHVNDLKFHSYTHAFMLGIVRYFNILHPRTTPKGFIL